MSTADPKAEIVQHHPNPYDEKAITPLSLIEMAVGQNADIDKLAKLMDLQMRWEANEAKKAYVKAMNAFKANVPEILKNKHVAYTTRDGKTTAYDHATLDAVCDILIPALSEYDLSHRWEVDQSVAGRIRVSCVVTHEMGHSERTTLEGPPDESGGKNAVQAISSTVTYLERYTFLGATGTAAKGTDNDGKGAPQWEKLQDYLDSLSTAPNLNVLQSTFKAGFKEAVALNNTEAMKMLTLAKDSRKAAIEKEEAPR